MWSRGTTAVLPLDWVERVLFKMIIEFGIRCLKIICTYFLLEADKGSASKPKGSMAMHHFKISFVIIGNVNRYLLTGSLSHKFENVSDKFLTIFSNKSENFCEIR